MASKNPKQAIITLIISLVLTPMIVLMCLMAGLSGLDSINYENQNKTLHYNVSDAKAQQFKDIAWYVVAPLSLIMTVLAIINLTIVNPKLNVVILVSYGVLVAGTFFILWAVSETWVEKSASTVQPLRVHSLKLS